MTHRRPSSAERLRALLAQPGLLTMPCCFDALSAQLVERAGFELTFMSGFAVSASRIGAPDTGLVSYGEMRDQGASICGAVGIPVLGDGDTGYGNALNVKRTVRGYAQVGFAAVMIEDQVAPKRCGHTIGKQVVERPEALVRIRAAVDARNEGADILILARTDARATHGLTEAIARAQAFAELGADIIFVEAPATREELSQVAAAFEVHRERASGPALMANFVEGGMTPMVAPGELESMGFKIAAFPLTLLRASVHAMMSALHVMKTTGMPPQPSLDFETLRRIVGFEDYHDEARRY